MAHLTTTVRLVGLAGAVPSARPPLPFTHTSAVGLVSGIGRDWRSVGDTSGTIRDRVMVKLTPSSPESPFVGGRVWLLRLPDGYKAWEGWSDAQGWYSARGLEVGVEYIAVGIDPYRDHKATGAGPVMAVKETP
jgi:hypothetical protein